MSDITHKLDKDTILSTTAKSVLFDSLMQGDSIKEAAQKVGLKYDYARKVCRKGHINALVRQEKAAIEARTAEKLEITVERQLREFDENVKLARQNGQISAANQALQEQGKLAGLYLEDNLQKTGKTSLIEAFQALGRKRIESREIQKTGDIESLAEKSIA